MTMRAGELGTLCLTSDQISSRTAAEQFDRTNPCGSFFQGRWVMLRGIFSAALAMVLSFTLGSTVCAVPIFQHTGTNDPTTESWSISGATTANLTVGSTGVGWRIDDDDAAGSLVYQQALSNPQSDTLSAGGWTASWELNVADTPTTIPNRAFEVNIKIPSPTLRRYNFQFGENGSGDPVVNAVTESIFTSTGSGGGYHRYDFVVPAGSNVGELFIDDVKWFDYDGWADTSAGIYWGSLVNSSIGEGHWRLFEIGVTPPPVPVPEPGTLALLVLGMVGIAARRRRS